MFARHFQADLSAARKARLKFCFLKSFLKAYATSEFRSTDSSPTTISDPKPFQALQFAVDAPQFWPDWSISQVGQAIQLVTLCSARTVLPCVFYQILDIR